MSQIYDLVKCCTCGRPWTEHDPACAGERYRILRMEEYRRLNDPAAHAVIQANQVRTFPVHPPTISIDGERVYPGPTQRRPSMPFLVRLWRGLLRFL